MQGKFAWNSFWYIVVGDFRTRVNGQFFPFGGFVGANSVPVLRVANVQEDDIQVGEALPTVRGILYYS